MKKLLTAFVTAALLVVCLCVPAFAADDCDHSFVNGVCSICSVECLHDYFPKEGSFVTHVCSICSLQSMCDFSSGTVCPDCGVHNLLMESNPCMTPNCSVYFVGSDDNHYVWCSSHDWFIPYSWLSGTIKSIPHDSSCNCSNWSTAVSTMSYSEYLVLSPVLRCSNLSLIPNGGTPPFGSVALVYDEVDHYLYCYDCGVVAPASLVVGVSTPHLNDDCAFCANLSRDYEVLGPISGLSLGVLPAITAFITAAIDWLSAFALCIISNPLFLIFVCSSSWV